MLFLMAGCSSSPEKLLSGQWDCKLDDESIIFRFDGSNGTAKATSSQGKKIDAQIARVDGVNLFLGSPEMKGQAHIRFTNDNSFVLLDTARPGSKGLECRRMN